MKNGVKAQLTIFIQISPLNEGIYHFTHQPSCHTSLMKTPTRLDVEIKHVTTYCGNGTCAQDDATISINGVILKYPRTDKVQAREIDPVNDCAKNLLEGLVYACKSQLGFTLNADVDIFLKAACIDEYATIDPSDRYLLECFLEASGDFIVVGYSYSYDDQWEYNYGDWGGLDDEAQDD